MDSLTPIERNSMTMSSRTQSAGAQTQVLSVLQHLVNEAATRFLALALETELRGFLLAHADIRLEDGSQAVARNGYLPPRILRTSVGGIRVRVPRTRDRSGGSTNFTSALVPPYHTRSRLDARLPEAWLQSCLTQDPQLFLSILLGEHVKKLPPLLVNELASQWSLQWRLWSERSLTTSMHLCWWAGLLPRVLKDGEDDEPYLAFIVGLYEDGRHELVHVARSSGDLEPEWSDLLAQLRRRGLRKGPQLTHAPQTPAFVRTLLQIFPDTLIGSEPWGGRERVEPPLRVV